MVLGFPRDPQVEFFLDRWRDVSTHVRQKPALTITHGRKDWAAKPSPSTCKFTLDDGPDGGDGDYDPNNPLGQWYGYLNRNVPVRVALGHGRDLYDRTVASGWGTSTSLGAWTQFNGAGTLASDVTSGVGRHLVTSTATYIAHYLDDVDVKNVEISTVWTLGTITVTGGDIEPANLMLRGTSTAGGYYMLRASINNLTQSVQLRLMSGDSFTLVGPVAVLTYPGVASALGMRFQAVGKMLRGKLWRIDQGEPLDWNITHDLENFAGDPAVGGWVGIRTGVAGGNSNAKPIVVSYDNTVVRSPRFAGETSKMVPLTSVDHVDQRTTVECASIRRRLSKGEKPLDTALHRYLTGGGLPFGVAEFWPLDYETDVADPGQNVIGTEPMAFLRSTGGALKWGTDTGLLQVQRAVTIVPPGTGSSGQMIAYTAASKYSAANGYAAVWWQRLGSDREASCIMDVGATQLFLKFDPGNVATLTWLPSATVVMTVGVPEVGDDTVWHFIALGARQSGGNVLFDLTIDDNPYEASLAGSIGVPEFIAFSAFPDTSDGYEITQVAMISNGMFVGSPWHVDRLREAYSGHASEHAGTRFARLAAEEGVPTSLIGDPDTTPAMGPQQPLPLLALLDQCVTVDQGAAFDPVEVAGLGMRMHRATTALDPVLTLDYASGHVAPEFGPTTDDQGTLNDVTAKRTNGDSFRVEQATGPNNTQDPGTDPNAAGRADTTVTTEVATDLNLPDQAGWRVHLGTVDEPRYPTVTVDLAAVDVAADPALVASVLDTGLEDAIAITGAQVRRIYDDVRLIVRGYTETLDTAFQHRIVFNTSPAAGYDVAVYGDPDDRYDTAGSSLAGTLTSSATSFTVNVTAGQPWTQTAARFPMHIWIGGERIRLSGIAAPSSATPPLTQVFTVDTGGRAVNGVAKAHAAGTPVRIFKPVYRGH